MRAYLAKIMWKPAPLSCDPEAIAIREACDYSLKIDIEEAKAGRAPRQVRIYATGIYDLYHSGHAKQFRQIRQAFKNPSDVYILSGTVWDAEVYQRKGPTVTDDLERRENLRHCRYLDEVVVMSPFVMTPEFLNENKIDFVAHDEAIYPSHDTADIYQWLRDAGIFYVTQRTPDISTTDLLKRAMGRRESFLNMICLSMTASKYVE